MFVLHVLCNSASDCWLKSNERRQVSLHFISYAAILLLNGLRIKKKIQQAKRKQVDFELRPQRRYHSMKIYALKVPRQKGTHYMIRHATPCHAMPPSSSIIPLSYSKASFCRLHRWGRRIIRKSNMKAFRCCNLWKFISFISDAADVVDVVVVIVVIAMIVICLIRNEMKWNIHNRIMFWELAFCSFCAYNIQICIFHSVL